MEGIGSVSLPVCLSVCLYVRMYCKELKPPEKNQNNTEFLIEFNKYIDSETPNHPSCECPDQHHAVFTGGPTGNVFMLTKAGLPGDAFTGLVLAAEPFQSLAVFYNFLSFLPLPDIDVVSRTSWVFFFCFFK